MKPIKTILGLLTLSSFMLATAAFAIVTPDLVDPEGKLSDLTAGLNLANGDLFGSGVAVIGDLDGDGVDDLAVGAEGTAGPGGANTGAVWILHMNADGSIKSSNRIDANHTLLSGLLDADDEFGTSVAAVGNLDGLGGPDIVVGAPNDDDVDANNDQVDDGAGINRGAVYVLFLNTDGSLRKAQKINDLDPTVVIPNNSDQFGDAVTSLGDLDGAGGSELALAVGAPGDRVDGFLKGAVWILFMTYNAGTDLMVVDGTQKISDSQGTPAPFSLGNSVAFGTSLSSLPDLDSDTRRELVVGSSLDDDGGANIAANRGAVYVMFMNADGTVIGFQKISDTVGGFTGVLEDSDFFGDSVQGLDDLDDDGVPELAVGAGGDDDGGPGRGAVYLLFLDYTGGSLSVATHTAGTLGVASHMKISNLEGGLDATLDNDDMFGGALSMSDLNGDGDPELLVGAPGDDDGAASAGAVHIAHLALSPVAICQNIMVEGDSTVVCTARYVVPADVDGGSYDPLGLPITLALEPPPPYTLGTNPVQLIVTNSAGRSDTCDATIDVDCPTPVELLAFDVARHGGDARLTWEVGAALDHAGFHVYREETGLERRQLTDLLLRGRERYEFIDENAPRGPVNYWLAEVSRTGDRIWHGPVTLAEAAIAPLVTLAQAHPNPFTMSTRITYSVPDTRPVTMVVYDVAGRRVATLVNEVQAPGAYTTTWDGRGDDGQRAALGLYLIRFVAGDVVETRKAVLAQ